MGDADYEQYTPYHFSLTGRCHYHVGRWQMPQFETLGVGPGAFSFFNGRIYTNEHNPAKYAQAVDEHLPPVMMAKKLTRIEQITRLAVLGIKFFTIDMETFREHSGEQMDVYYGQENDIATIFGTDTAMRTKYPQAVDLMRI